MTEPDPDPIVARLAASAKEIVDEAGEVAREASKKINNGTGYSAADLLGSMTKLTNVAFAGGLELAKAGMDGLSQPGPRAVADQMAVISRRMISESGKVAGEASDLLDKQQFFKPTDWVQAMVKLADIALFGGIELAETALAGPGQYEKAPIRETFKVTPDNVNPRLLTILSLSRPGAADAAVGRVGFDPSDRVLPKGQSEFSILVDAAGLASGKYIGEVHIGEVDPAAPAGVVQDDVVVTVAL
jgi:hypothetical protein